MVEKQYEEILKIIGDLIRYGASYTEAWNMDYRVYRHYINAKRSSIEDDLNNDRTLYTEQVANISRVLSGKKIKQPSNIKIDKLDTNNARRRRDKRNRAKKYKREKVAAWAAFTHTYHTAKKEVNTDGTDEGREAGDT